MADETAPSARPQREPLPNTTLAERAAARTKQVKAARVEDKTVASEDSDSKATPRKATRRSK